MGEHIYKRKGGGVLTLTLPTYDLSPLESDVARERLSRFYGRLDSLVLSYARRIADDGSARSIRCSADIRRVGDTLRVERTYEIIGDITRKFASADAFKLLADGSVRILKYSKNQRLHRHGTDKNSIFRRKRRNKSSKNIR